MRKYILPLVSLLCGALFTVASAQSVWQLFTTSNSGLPSNSIRDIHFGSGMAFLATGDGVAVTDLVTFTVYDTSNSGLPTNDILTVVPSASGMVIGTAGEGLVLFDNGNWLVRNTQNSALPDDHVKALLIEDTLLWIGTTGGIARYNGISWKIFDTGNSILWSNNVNCIGKGENGLKYVGMLNGGLATIQYDTVVALYVAQNSSIQDNSVTGIVFDSSGMGWMSFPSNGFQQSQPAPGLWFHTANSQIPTDGLEDIAIAPDQALWFATQSTGIFCFKNGVVQVFDVNNSLLPVNAVTCLNVDSLGRVWIGTENNGLIVLDPQLLHMEMLYPQTTLHIFPNPSAGSFHIVADAQQEFMVHITGISGHEIRQVPVNGETIVSGLPPGIYLVSSGRFTAKVIVTASH